jgi:hypothetical protein
MFKMKKRKIKVIDIHSLATTSIKSEISLNDLSLWLKCKTGHQYVIFDKNVILKLIEYAINHNTCFKNDFVGKNLDLDKDKLQFLKDCWL